MRHHSARERLAESRHAAWRATKVVDVDDEQPPVGRDDHVHAKQRHAHVYAHSMHSGLALP